MFQTGESGTIKERGECQGSVYISHSSCLYFKWEGCEEIWRADVVQGNAHKQERQFGFSDNCRQSYFRWPDTLTEVPMTIFCWLCGELHWALGIVSHGRSSASRVVWYEISVSSACCTCVCVQPCRTLAGWNPTPAAPAPAAPWALAAGAVSVCLRARLKTRYRSGKGKPGLNQQFSFENSGLESRTI